ncbi:MAG: glycosyltransferase 87 family protein [Dehalococcoidales bacterium]|nr:glycosyltransferase 87 family protein [Dehalococcoidales bacterium]
MGKKAKGNNPFTNLGNKLAFFPVDAKPHYMLFFVAVAVQLIASAVSGIGYSVDNIAFWMVGLVFWLLWFFIMFLIVRPQTDVKLQKWGGVLKRGAILIFIVMFVVGVAETVILTCFTHNILDDGVNSGADEVVQALYDGFRYNDGTALSQQAAENLLDGKNPYTNSNIVTALEKYDGVYDRVTPLQKGRFEYDFPYPSAQQIEEVWNEAKQNPSQIPEEIESKVCYPAGTFLSIAPFIAIGITDIRIIYAIIMIAALVYVAWRVPNKRRLIFIGVTLCSLELWNTLGCGETGLIIFPLLLIAWVTLGENDWVSGLFMGLAVATKQTAWFFLPFFGILLFRTWGWKRFWIWAGVIIAVFFATNGYFIINNPEVWMNSIMAPMLEPMFPLGVGAVSLVTSGLVNIHTTWPFVAAEIGVLIGGGLWYLRYCKKYPDIGPVLAILPLFFAWRSLWTYFYYVAIIVLARMLIKEEDEGSAIKSQ